MDISDYCISKFGRSRAAGSTLASPHRRTAGCERRSGGSKKMWKEETKYQPRLVIYRKCTPRTICILYGKKRLIEFFWANWGRPPHRLPSPFESAAGEAWVIPQVNWDSTPFSPPFPYFCPSCFYHPTRFLPTLPSLFRPLEQLASWWCLTDFCRKLKTNLFRQLFPDILL